MEFHLEHVDCDLCGGAPYRLRYRKPDDWLWGSPFEFPVVECVECGLVYVNPRPTPESMSAFYPDDYHDDRTGPEWEARYSLELDYLRRQVQPQRWLDIGCARGDFLLRVQRKYPEAELFGVDPYSTGVRDGSIHFSADPLPACGFDADRFDVITSWAVFEHLHRPSEYFEEVFRILEPGGRFVFLVTNSESLWSRRSYLEDIPRHTYHFSERTLQAYANRFGFRVENIAFDDKIWDSRGRRTFRYALENLLGVSWERRRSGRLNLARRAAGKIGRWLDRIVFSRPWESRRRRSGIIVAEFRKPLSAT